MNRGDFIKRLTELLADVSPAERDEAIQYYNDYFDDAGAENEQSVIVSLGSPEQLARSIKTGLVDGVNMGEFTEKGFSGYESKKSDEVMDLNTPEGAGSERRASQGSDSGWREGQGSGNGWTHGADNNWQQGTNNGWAHDADNNWQQNTNNGWQQGNGQGGNNDGQNNYNGYKNSYEENRNTSQSPKRMSGGMIALIVILCICASPLIIGIAGGLFGIIVGILGGLFGIVIGLGAAAISLMIVGVCLFVYGITLLFGMPLGGLAMMGVGMVCAAVGLFFLWLTVVVCGMFIPAIIRGIVKLFNNLFHRGGVTA